MAEDPSMMSIYQFHVICDTSNNTPATMARQELMVDVEWPAVNTLWMIDWLEQNFSQSLLAALTPVPDYLAITRAVTQGAPVQSATDETAASD